MSLTMHDRAHIFFSRRVFFSVGHCSLSRVVSFVAPVLLQQAFAAIDLPPLKPQPTHPVS